MKVRIPLVFGIVLALAMSSLSVAYAADKPAAPKKPQAAAAETKAEAAAPAPKKEGAPVKDGQYKIGVVDRGEVLKNYNKVKMEYEALKADVDKRQKDIDSKFDVADALKKQYEEKRDKLSPAERADLEQKIESAFNAYRQLLQTEKSDLDSKEEAIIKKAASEIEKVIDEIGTAEGYHIILGNTATMYYSTAIDITSKVVEKLNAKK